MAWRLFNTLDTTFCLDALGEALDQYRPDIFNSDQGSQYTSEAFAACLQSHGVAISMDGRGHALDNVFIERLWRSVKYEEIYLKLHDLVADLETGLTQYFDFTRTNGSIKDWNTTRRGRCSRRASIDHGPPNAGGPFTVSRSSKLTSSAVQFLGSTSLTRARRLLQSSQS